MVFLNIVRYCEILFLIFRTFFILFLRVTYRNCKNIVIFNLSMVGWFLLRIPVSENLVPVSIRSILEETKLCSGAMFSWVHPFVALDLVQIGCGCGLGSTLGCGYNVIESISRSLSTLREMRTRLKTVRFRLKTTSVLYFIFMTLFGRPNGYCDISNEIPNWIWLTRLPGER